MTGTRIIVRYMSVEPLKASHVVCRQITRLAHRGEWGSPGIGLLQTLPPWPLPSHQSCLAHRLPTDPLDRL